MMRFLLLKSPERGSAIGIPQNTFFEILFQTCRKEVSEAVSEMAHTFYVFPEPEQLSASFRLQTFL